MDSDEIQVDKDEVVIGKFEVFVNDGSDLYTEQINMLIEVASNGSTTVTEMLEDIELKNMTTNETISMDRVGDASSTEETYEYDTRVDFANGKNVFFIYANVPNLQDTARTDFDGAEFTISFEDIETYAMVFQEDTDDQVVTDVTPSSLTLNTVVGVLSSFDLDVISMDSGTPFKAVRGTDEVPAMVFDVKAGSISDIHIEDLVLTGKLGGGALDINDDNTQTQEIVFVIDEDGITYADGATYEIDLNNEQIQALSTDHSTEVELRDYFYAQLDATNSTVAKATMGGVDYDIVVSDNVV